MKATLRRIYFNPYEESVKSERYFKIGIKYLFTE